MKISDLTSAADGKVKAFLKRNPSSSKKLPHLIYGCYIIFSLLAAKIFLVVPLLTWAILCFIARNLEFLISTDDSERISTIKIHGKWVLDTFLLTLVAFLFTVLAANFEQKMAIVTVMIANSFWVAYRLFYGWRCLIKGQTPFDIFGIFLKKCVVSPILKLIYKTPREDAL